MNLVVLKGNLTKDPDVREVSTAGGKKTKVANFTLAISRFFKKKDGERDKDTSFILCEAWDTGAEIIEKLLKKGDPVLLNGSLKTETWEKDGVKQYRTKVRVSNFDKLYRSPATGNEEAAPAAAAAAPTADAKQEGEPDIPF